MQEFDALTALKDVDRVLQVIDYDNGERVPANRNVPQHLYVEFLEGQNLEQAMDDWKKVSSIQGPWNCSEDILGRCSSSGLAPHSLFIDA